MANPTVEVDQDALHEFRKMASFRNVPEYANDEYIADGEVGRIYDDFESAEQDSSHYVTLIQA